MIQLSYRLTQFQPMPARPGITRYHRPTLGAFWPAMIACVGSYYEVRQKKGESMVRETFKRLLTTFVPPVRSLQEQRDACAERARLLQEQRDALVRHSELLERELNQALEALATANVANSVIKPAIGPPITYDQDGLRTVHNADFLDDLKFQRAMKRGALSHSHYPIEWRIHVVS